MLPPRVKMKIFSDASFDPASKRGIAAHALLLDDFSESVPTVATKLFSAASCAQLEVVAVLWALETFEERYLQCCRDESGVKPELTLFTDSQAIAGLSARRVRLEGNDFKSGKSGQALTNAAEYRRFFAACDRLQNQVAFEVKWIKGHSKSLDRTQDQRVFALVDQEARSKLRKCTPT